MAQSGDWGHPVEIPNTSTSCAPALAWQPSSGNLYLCHVSSGGDASLWCNTWTWSQGGHWLGDVLTGGASAYTPSLAVYDDGLVQLPENNRSTALHMFYNHGEGSAPPPPSNPPSIDVPANHATVTDPNVTFSGHITDDNVFTVHAWDESDQNDPIANAPVTQGRWSFTSNRGPWSLGTHTVTFRAVTNFGQSPPAQVSFTVAAPPAAPPQIAVPGDEATGVDPNVVFSGTAGADTARVRAWASMMGSYPIADVPVTGGQWSFTSNEGPWAPGTHSVTVKGVNIAGEGPGADVHFSVSGSPAPTPAGAPHIAVPGDGATGLGPNVGFSGTVDTDTNRVRAWDDTSGHQQIADAPVTMYGGQWSFTSDLGPWAPGTHTVSVKGVNSAGEGPATSVSFTVGAPPPPPVPAAAPVILAPSDDSSVGPDVVFSGTAGADTTEVRAWIFGGPQIADVLVANGRWEFTSILGPWAPGAHVVQVKGVNSSGESLAASHVAFTAGPPPAEAPIIYFPSDQDPDVSATVKFIGTALSTDTSSVRAWNSAGQVIADNVPVSGNGNWNFTSSQGAWSVGSQHSVSVRGVNAYGEGPASHVSFTVGTAPSDAPIIDTPQDGAPDVGQTVEFTGTAGPDLTTVEAWDDTSGQHQSIGGSVVLQGKWSFSRVQGAWDPGPHKVSVNLVNSHGPGPAAHVSFIVSSAPPPPPPLGVPVILFPPDRANVAPDVVFRGTASEGAVSVIATDDTFGGDDDVVATAPVIGGEWHFTRAQGPWDDGEHRVIVKATKGPAGSGVQGPGASVWFTSASIDVAITHPAPDAVGVDPKMTITGTADGGVISVIAWDTTNGRHEQIGTSYVHRGQWQVTRQDGQPWSPGPHTVTIQGHNSSGETGTSPHVSFTVS